MPNIIGVDLGGTKIAISRLDTCNLESEETIVFSTEAENGFDDVYTKMLHIISEYLTNDTVGIGLGVPGLIDWNSGVITTLPNISGAKGFPLKQHLLKDLQSHTHWNNGVIAIDNDANCFTLYESIYGKGKEHDICIGVVFGTGVGGGISINKSIYRGAHGNAGEFGHMLMMPGNPPYASSDTRGDVEQFLSGVSLHKRSITVNTFPSSDVDVCTEIAWLCTNLTYTYDPDILVFGGSTGKAFNTSLENISHQLQQWTIPDTPLPKIAVSEQENAGLLGAGLLALQLLET